MSGQGSHSSPSLMTSTMHGLIGSCRDIGKLTSRAMDESLPLGQRIKLRVHLMMCKWCRRNARQLFAIRAFLRLDDVDHPDHDMRMPEPVQKRLQQFINQASDS